MGIFKRVQDITLSNINSLLDKAEDPVILMDQYLRDMAEDIQDAEGAVAKQIAVSKRFEQQLVEAKELVTKRGTQAMTALENNNEDLARRALESKKEEQLKVDSLQPQFEISHTNSQQLKSQLNEMKDQYTKMKGQRDILASRHEAAKAQNSINKTMSSFNSGGAMAGIERMSEKVLQAEAEAQAGMELRDSSKGLDDELDSLDKSDGVDDELAELKAQLANKSAQ
jgi:phage shock protein A